jgi:hypothetical protein
MTIDNHLFHRPAVGDPRSFAFDPSRSMVEQAARLNLEWTGPPRCEPEFRL